MTEHQLKLQKQKINTVHTKRLDQAKEHLGRNNLLILVGNEGDGVTTLGMDILASYDDRERYNVKDVEETFECLTKTADKNIIVLVNDVFGTNKLNMKRFESWDTNMDRIETRIDIDDSILVLVINSKTMNTTACEEFCRRHFDGVLTISKPDLQLDIAEMKGILKCRIKSKKGIEICRFDNQENLHRDFDRGISGLYRISQNTIDSIANTALNSGFPRKVDQFVNRLSDRNLRKGAAFFNEPTPELVNDIEQLRLSDNAKDQYKYISLVAVFVYGQLNLKEFESGILRLQNSGKLSKLKRIARSGAKSKEYPELLHILVAIAKERNMLPWLVDVVGRGLELLLDKYVKGLKHDNYLLASVSIEMAVAVSCANRFPIDVCIFSSQCAFQCIFGPDDVFEKNEVHVSVKENDKTLLLAVMQRLSLIQETKELKMFLQHPAMRSAWFVQLYLKYLKSKKHGLKKLILATDTNNNSILVLSLEYPYKPTTMIGTKCLTDDILNSKEWLQIQKKRPRFVDKQYKCIVQKCYEFDSKSYFSYYLEILDVELTKHALFLAVDDYCRNIIEELIKRKLFTDDEWYEALKRACNQLKTDDEDTMKIVLAIKYRIGFDYQSRAVESIIHTAGRQGNIDLLSKVVTLYKNKNFQNYIGQTCIHIATTMNHLDFVKQALDFGISQTILDKQCLLPLHIACKYGHMDIVKILISHDIEVINYVSDSCGSPLLVATACGHDKIASYLIANGARSFRYLTGRSHMTFGECLNLEDDVDYDEGTLSRQGNTRSGKCTKCASL